MVDLLIGGLNNWAGEKGLIRQVLIGKGLIGQVLIVPVLEDTPVVENLIISTADSYLCWTYSQHVS